MCVVCVCNDVTWTRCDGEMFAGRRRIIEEHVRLLLVRETRDQDVHMRGKLGIRM